MDFGIFWVFLDLFWIFLYQLEGILRTKKNQITCDEVFFDYFLNEFTLFGTKSLIYYFLNKIKLTAHNIRFP